MTNAYVDAGNGFQWVIAERNPVKHDEKKHDLARDSEVEVLSSMEGLGVEFVLAPVTPDEREQVKDLPHVSRVFDGGFASVTPEPPNADELVEIDGMKALEVHRVPELWAKGLTGKGIKVAVLDTGLDPEHAKTTFAGRVAEVWSAYENDGADRQGHGTFCAGQVAGPKGFGCAPDAMLYIAKVLGDNGSGSYSAIIKGLEWAVSQGCKVASLSLGGPGGPDSAISRAVDAAYAKGVVVCCAAGNDQRGSNELESDKHAPGSARDAVCVGATDVEGNIADFSNAGKSLDIAAVGVRVSGLGLSGRTDATMSGTSMATPHVAGVATLLCGLEKPGSTVRAGLYGGAKDTGLPFEREGNGILDALAGHTKLVGAPKPPEPKPERLDVGVSYYDADPRKYRGQKIRTYIVRPAGSPREYLHDCDPV